MYVSFFSFSRKSHQCCYRFWILWELMMYSFRRLYGEETPGPAIRAGLCTTLGKTTTPVWDGLRQNTLCIVFARRSKKCATDLSKTFLLFSILCIFFLLPSSSCCCSWDHTLFFPSRGFINSLMSSSHLFWGLPTNLLVLIWLSSPGCQLMICWSIFLLVGMQFYLPYATSVFCVFQPSMVSSFSSCSLLLLWYFSWCIQSSLFFQ